MASLFSVFEKSWVYNENIFMFNRVRARALLFMKMMKTHRDARIQWRDAFISNNVAAKRASKNQTKSIVLLDAPTWNIRSLVLRQACTTASGKPRHTRADNPPAIANRLPQAAPAQRPTYPQLAYVPVQSAASRVVALMSWNFSWFKLTCSEQPNASLLKT